MILGIDIGGTNVKFGLINEAWQVIRTWSIATEAEQGDLAILSRIIAKTLEIQTEVPFDLIGVGSPGTLDCKTGVCIRASNLPYKNTPLISRLTEATHIPAYLVNDATAAVYGELYAGAGCTYSNLVMVTLGTGVGGGIAIEGKPYQGRTGRAGEIGHMVIQQGGLPCRCGQAGCFEQYASVTALIRQTREAITRHPDSLLAQMCTREVTGRSVFDAIQQGCPTAKAVLDQYTEYLSVGIMVLQNIFDPDAIIIGGAISGQGEHLLAPIREKLTKPLNLLTSALQNDAGIIGAAVVAEKRHHA